MPTSDRRGFCQKASELLIQGDYERLNELLHETTAAHDVGEIILRHLVEAASHLTQLCQQWQTEAQWHQQALSEAQSREHELLLRLHAVLSSLLGNSSSLRENGIPVEPGPRIPPPSKPSLSAEKSPQPAKWAGQNFPDWEYSSPMLVEKSPPQETPKPASKAVPKIVRPSRDKQPLPTLMVYCLGPFRVYLDDQLVQNWPNCKGKSIFKYLVTQRKHPVAKEILMDLFWPEADPDAARNSLNVAIYALRKALSKVNPDFSYVVFEDGSYLLNPELRLWVDFEDFMAHVQRAKEYERRGETAAAVHEFRAAEAIYQKEFLVEDRYEDWLIETRQNFQNTYLAVMDNLTHYYFEQKDYETCVTLCTKALGANCCNEEVHRRLIRCYSHMGQPHLALRQFHFCREAMTHELDISPSRETVELFRQIRDRQPV